MKCEEDDGGRRDEKNERKEQCQDGDAFRTGADGQVVEIALEFCVAEDADEIDVGIDLKNDCREQECERPEENEEDGRVEMIRLKDEVESCRAEYADHGEGDTARRAADGAPAEVFRRTSGDGIAHELPILFCHAAIAEGAVYKVIKDRM